MSFRKFLDCRGILLDFGGTLDSDGEHWLDRFYDLYPQAGLNLPAAEIKEAFYRADTLCCADQEVNHLGLRPLMKYHVRLQFEFLNLAENEKQEGMVDAFCRRSELFLERNVRLLGRLKNRYRLGVVSNFYGNVDIICREAGLFEFLEVILDSVRFGSGKPDPDIFLAAKDRLGLSPPQIVFVGDSYERDMIPAREIGMKTVWLKGPNPRVPAHAGPVDAWITNLTQLDALVP